MNGKKKIILILGAVIIVVLVILIIFELKNQSLINSAVKEEGNSYLPGEGAVATNPRDWEETETRKAVPEGVVVPEPNEVIAEELKDKIAVPSSAVPAAPGITAQNRIFNIRGEGGKFIPESIIANYNDTVHIEFTAIDRDYDIVFAGYNMSQNVLKSQTKIIEFQALKDGRFPYYCTSCGGSATNPQGEIIIKK